MQPGRRLRCTAVRDDDRLIVACRGAGAVDDTHASQDDDRVVDGDERRHFGAGSLRQRRSPEGPEARGDGEDR